MRTGRFAGLGAIVALLMAPAAAHAADTFVAPGGNDLNDCLSTGTACATIGTAIPKAGAGDTIHVAPGTYSEAQLGLDQGKSLVASGPGPSIIMQAFPALGTQIGTSGGATMRIEGFTIRCPDCNVDQVDLNGPTTFTGNTFDGNTTASQGDLRIGFGSGAVTVDQNTFTDPTTADSQIAITDNSQNQPTISSNQISGFFNAIVFKRAGTGTMVRDNDISGTHNAGGGGAAMTMSPSGNDPANDNVNPTLVHNNIHDPINVGGGNPLPAGIFAVGDLVPGGPPTIGVTMRRNTITGATPAVSAGGTEGSVTLQSDLIVAGTPGNVGIQSFENADPNNTSSLGDVTATNVTVIGAITLQDTHLTFDSSILNGLMNDTFGTTPSCTISFSDRFGSADVPPAGNGCDGSNFSSLADPQFVNSGTGNYHLQSTSPLIDAGSPANPDPALLDIDGEARALASRCGWSALRDIGADEFSPCSNAETQIDSGPGEGSISNSASASFDFSGPGVPSFECRLDGSGFAPCTTPVSFSGLAEGSHTFAVRGAAPSGSVDLSPASRTWTVDTVPPDTSIDSGPADGTRTNNGSPTYGFSSEPGATFECSLGGPFTPCSSPDALTNLGDGTHVFAVRAVDTAGNTDPTPAIRTLIVDTTPPNTTLRKPHVNGNTAKLRFGSTEAGASFVCKLDRRPFKPCKSPKTYRGLHDGKHRVKVISTDAFGNSDTSAARATFVIEG